MASIFHIVLRDPRHYDTYATREFDLPLSATFPIGRASSNASKKELMAAPHNAYIDSPVISRQHAVLSANSDSGVPEVYISDQGSMHGTMLNGHRLSPNTPTKLSYGDELQFGTDVNRNEEFYVARTYVFESQLSRPFCPGFTVPDPESEEEDVVERRGSLTDPFIIDSSSASDQSEGNEQEQTTMVMVMDQVLSQDEPDKTSTQCPPSAMRATVVDEDYEETTKDAVDEYEGVWRNTSYSPSSPLSSEAGSVDYPDIESDSEADIQDSENEEMEETECPTHISSPSIQTQAEHDPSAVPPVAQHRYIYNSDDTAQAQHYLPRVSFLGPQRFENHSIPSMNVPGESSFPIFDQQNVCTGFNFEDTHSNYMGMPSFCGYSGQMFQADQLPSPPPMPTSDVEASGTMQPGRRTKVSIEEIVDEQPPTPESVNSLKRKADVLEEEEPATVSEEVVVKEAAVIAQRPKKTPRSVLSRVLLGATGAVVSFALLSTLPDTFFV